MARKRGGRKRRYFPKIYFGKDSVFKVVPDIGRPGCKSRKEFRMIAFAQLADYADKKTKDHYARTIPFTERLWQGRTMVLRKLAEKLHDEKTVKIIERAKEELDEARSWKEKKEILMEVAEKLGIDEEEAERIMKRVSR